MYGFVKKSEKPGMIIISISGKDSEISWFCALELLKDLVDFVFSREGIARLYHSIKNERR